VVPTHSRQDDLVVALESLNAAAGQRRSFEIVVVDNGSTDGTAALVEAWKGRASCPVRYVTEPRIGLHHARHAGARAAVGEILAFIDDDVRVEPTWLDAIRQAFSGPDVAVVGGPILPEWGAVPPRWIGSVPASYLSLLDLGDDPVDLHWPEAVYGCNLAVRRSVLFEVGGFNPDGFADRRRRWLRGDGEMGLQRKVYAAGYRVRYDPGARVRHRIPAWRLTPAYFGQRAANSAISEVFGAIRSRWLALPSPSTPEPGSRRPERGAARHSPAWRAPAPKAATAVRLRIRIVYWRTVLGYLARLAIRPSLRQHVLRRSFLD
jgi:glycosyltransferase involved in cell wall biosynthesis